MAAEISKVVPLTCHGHSRPITHLNFSSLSSSSHGSHDASSPPPASAPSDDQYYMLSCCKDNNPMLRDGVTGDWIGTFIGHKGAVWQGRLSSDATLAATASADFSAKVWDTQTGEALHTLQHNHIVRAVAFPQQDRPQVLATGGAEKKLRIWDLSLGGGQANGDSHAAGTNGATSISSHEVGPSVHTGTIRSIVWTPDPSILITASEDKKIRWWDLRQRSSIGEHTLDGPLGTCELDNITSSTYSDCTPTLSVAAGKSVYFFSPTRPAELLKQVQLPQEVASVALHSGARKFVTGSSGDTYVRVWDFDTEEELDVGKGHHGPVWTVSFSPDGQTYASGSEDGTVKLWKFTQGAYGLWR